MLAKFLQDFIQWNAFNGSGMMTGKPMTAVVVFSTISYWKLVAALLVLYLTWEQAYFLASRQVYHLFARC